MKESQDKHLWRLFRYPSYAAARLCDRVAGRKDVGRAGSSGQPDSLVVASLPLCDQVWALHGQCRHYLSAARRAAAVRYVPYDSVPFQKIGFTCRANTRVINECLDRSSLLMSDPLVL